MAESTQLSLFPLYDLHSHTDVSDGLLSPEALVMRAAEKKISVLAITDHDTIAGLAPAHAAIARHRLPLRLLDGVELSTLWENHEIHVVGLGIDVQHPALNALLTAQKQRRQARAELIAQRLEKAHISGALAGVQQLAQGGVITRGHFARYLIAQQKASDMAGVFKRYLSRGKTGYAPPQWCTIEQTVDVIHRSGGCAVLAHPGRYDLTAKWLKRLLLCFKQAGGDAMEVAQCQQAPGERKQLGQYAQDYQLAASQGSDFHQPSSWIELGKNLWLPAGVEPLWQRFPQLAGQLPADEEGIRGPL